MRWLVCDYVAEAIPALIHPSTFILADPRRAPLGGTPVANYKSFARFLADVRGGVIDPAYRWVMYDPESWVYTPKTEAQHPGRFMRRNCHFVYLERTLLSAAFDFDSSWTHSIPCPGRR